MLREQLSDATLVSDFGEGSRGFGEHPVVALFFSGGTGIFDFDEWSIFWWCHPVIAIYIFGKTSRRLARVLRSLVVDDEIAFCGVWESSVNIP